MRRPSLAFVLVSMLALPGFDWPGGAARVNAALRDPSPERRSEAVREASRSPDADARRALLSALDDADERVRLEAAAAVARTRFVEAAPTLNRWLDAPSAQLRLAATRTLGSLRAAASLGSLTRMLSDADVSVRTEAVRAVAAAGGAVGTVALLDRLSDTEATVRVETARALGSLGDRRAMFTLLGALQDSSVEVRAAAAEALGRLADPRALRGLVSALHDPAYEARSAAVRALARLGRDNPDAVADLAVVALREGREWEPAAQTRLAVEAVEALGRIATAPACDALIEVVRRGAESVDRAPVHAAFRALSQQRSLTRDRVASLLAVTAPEFIDPLVDLLGEVGGEASARALLRQLDRSDLTPTTRARALRSLGRTGSTLALLPLIAEAERVPPAGRVALPARDCARVRLNPSALVGLAALASSSGSLGPDALDLVGALLDRAGESCSIQSAQLVTLLGRTGNTRAPARIRPLLASSSQLIRSAAVGALVEAGVAGAERELAALLGDLSPSVRVAASNALSRHGGGAAVDALVDRWNTGAPIDRTAAARALGRALRSAPSASASRAVEVLARCAREAPFAVSAACVDALADAVASSTESPALAVIETWLGQGDEAHALVALEACSNARATSLDAALSERIRARLSTGLRGARLSLRLTSTLRWVSSTDAEVLDALASGTAELAANAVGSLRHVREPLSPTLRGALWEALRTRQHEAVLVNAALALAGSSLGTSEVDAALELLANHPSPRVRAAVAALVRSLSEAALDDSARARLRSALDRCATGDRAEAVRLRCSVSDSPRRDEARAPIDARVVDANGAARAMTDYALVLPDGWIRLGTTGPDGWIHERDAVAGTFYALDRSELFDAP